MLTDPNSVLMDHISKQKILSPTTIIISTNPSGPPFDGLFGGSTDNIAFLLGDSNTPPKAPNADAVQVDAIFWIERVEAVLHIPFFTVGSPPVFVRAQASVPGQRVAQFSVTPKEDIEFPGRDFTVTFTQIQVLAECDPGFQRAEVASRVGENADACRPH
jgi:hypothetical protein